MNKKLLTGIGIIGLGAVLLSFANGNDPKMKKYEVIRSVDGQVSVYDTLVPENSKLTPEGYLDLLGFSDDKDIQIIQIPSFNEQTFTMPCPPNTLIEMDSVMMIHVQDFDVSVDSVFQVHAVSAEGMEDLENMYEQHNILIRQVDSLNEEVMEMERIIEIQITDSTFNPDVMVKMDSMTTMVHTIVVHSEDGEAVPAHVKFEAPEGEPDFERHIEEGNMKANVMVYGDQEDFTIVMVSDASAADTKSSSLKPTPVMAPDNALKVYPNPADKEVAIQLNFDTKATTNVTVTDSRGKVVLQLNLGEFSGAYNQTVDVSKWSKGIYFVNIDRPGVRLVEKLVVE